MYRITIFSKVSPATLSKQLSTVRFKVNSKTGEVFWKGESGQVFIIIPFKEQSRDGLNGYRIHSDYPISTIIYLFQGAFDWIGDVKVTGIEYEKPLAKSKQEHLNDCLAIPSMQIIDGRGLFTRNDVMVVLLDDKIVLQRRVKLKKLNEELSKIEDIQDILFPASFDLFSFLEEERVG